MIDTSFDINASSNPLLNNISTSNEPFIECRFPRVLSRWIKVVDLSLMSLGELRVFLTSYFSDSLLFLLSSLILLLRWLSSLLACGSCTLFIIFLWLCLLSGLSHISRGSSSALSIVIPST